MTSSRLAQGNLALRNKEYEAAIHHYTIALSDNPGIAHLLRANIELARRRAGIQESVDVGCAALVDVVVPVYNALDDVKKCLASLQRCTDQLNVKVIVVNDGSDESTTQWLREFCSAKSIFQLLEHPENAGYTKAVNTGLKASTAAYVITQNSDTVVAPGWLTGLIRCMNASPKIGIVGPLSNAASWQNVPSLRDEQGAFAVNDLPLGYTVDDMAQVVQQASTKAYPRIPFVNGFCFMIKREVINAIGYMDEENFPVGYGEENDYCIRAIDAGFELAIADDVYVFHAKSRSFGHERRAELSKNGTESLKRKHTPDKYYARVNVTKNTYTMDEVRARIQQAMHVRQLESSCEASASNHGNNKHVCSTQIVDMHGEAVSLFPPPCFGSKEYEVQPQLTTPCLIFPYEDQQDDLRRKKTTFSVGIQLHLYYEDLLDEFVYFLKNIAQPFTLYVSIVNQESNERIQSELSRQLPLAKVIIEVCPNRGRDIGPFLVGFGKRLLQHDLICHIHSKRSLHNRNKADWRRQLLTNLLGSSSIVQSIFETFQDNPHAGMIFPEYHHSLLGQISWGTNFSACKEFSNKLGLQIHKDRLPIFPAGSMFWARKDALRNLLGLPLTWGDFQEEAGQVDGTLAHAVERLMGQIVLSNNFEILQSKSEKPHNLIFYYPHKWPYKPLKTTEELIRTIAAYKQSKAQKMAKYAIYTAMTGGYDQPVVHENLSNKCDYIFYTDSPANDRGFWDIRTIQYTNEQLVRLARHIKVNPHKYLDGYDVAVWIDANVVIRGDIFKYVQLAIDDPDTALFGIPHPHRNCLYDEAEAVVAAKRDTREMVAPQLKRYQAEGFPRKHGLIETNMLVINLRHPKTATLFEEWSRELESGSHRDQLSLNYCLWKTGVQWKPIFIEKITLRDSFDFAYLGHGKNSGYPANLYIPQSKLVIPK